MTMWQWIARMAQIRRERHQLRDMSDAMLKDIGVDRLRARREANRPPWDFGLK